VKIRENADLLAMHVKRPYCCIVLKLGDCVGLGFSKCGPRDKWNPQLGLEIAEGRAAQEILRQQKGRSLDDEGGVVS